MREIDNNMSNLNFKGIQKADEVQSANISTPAETVSEVQTKEINDLSKLPSASIGKSQVNASDSIENDMKILAKKPELVQELNRIVDEYSKNHTEEETLKFMDSAIHELVKK